MAIIMGLKNNSKRSCSVASASSSPSLTVCVIWLSLVLTFSSFLLNQCEAQDSFAPTSDHHHHGGHGGNVRNYPRNTNKLNIGKIIELNKGAQNNNNGESSNTKPTSIGVPPPPPPHPVYDFARNLFLTTTDWAASPEENVLISPFSVRAITGLIYLAAKGKSAEEIGHALQFSNDPDRLISALGKHIQQTQTQPGQSFVFKVGNGIFIQNGVSLNRNYVETVRHKLQSYVSTTDFRIPRRAAADINNWVSNITEDKINNLVDRSTLSPDTTVFLGNALFFSGQWEKPFDGSVPKEESLFQLSTGKYVTVPMMQVETAFGYTYISKLKATGISIPFKDQRFEFIIVKPDESLEETENLLRNYPLNMLATEIKSNTRNVVLKMPKFKLDVNYNLVDVMKQLGMTSIFDPSRADLTGLTKGGETHVVSQVVHQTSLEINEHGAIAAAATGVEIYPISSPSIFAIDKPFLFMINDRLTGPVLIGHLVNPVDQAHIIPY